MATIYLLATSCCTALVLTFPAPSEERLRTVSFKWLHVFDLLIRLTLIILESRSKTGSMDTSLVELLSPEEKVGLLNSTFFWWMNDILISGYDRLLCSEDLPSLDQLLTPDTLRGIALRTWDARGW